MFVPKLILLSILGIIYCQENNVFYNKYIVLCDVNDIECLSKAAVHYLRTVSQGVPELDIKAYDPLVLESTQLVPFPGVKLHLKFANITGMRNHKLHQFNHYGETANLSTKGDINIDSDFTAEINNKTYPPVKLTIKSTVIGTVNYEHSIKADDKGVEHFFMGPDTISCQVTEELQFSISDPTLIDEIRKGKAAGQTQGKQIKETLVCLFVEQLFKPFVQSLRAFAEHVPKNKFLKNI